MHERLVNIIPTRNPPAKEGRECSVFLAIDRGEYHIMHTCRSLSQITTWAFLKECKMASTAALQVQVHEAGGLQRRQAGTAFADLLSAMEALPEAFLAGKSWIFITELRLLHLWVHSSPVMLGC